MRLTAAERAMLRVSKAQNQTLNAYKEGVYLEKLFGVGIDDLKHRACVDRLAFADSFIVTANKLLRGRPAQYRSAISRYYYAMYHTARAVVYFEHSGDDHQGHSDLQTKLPKSFPNRAIWQNSLKDARSHRNDADYDPYPNSSSDWRMVALDLSVAAPEFVNIGRGHLRKEGCVGA